MDDSLDIAHFNMLEQQVRPSNVLDIRVLQALKNVARIQFVDESLAGLAYADTELPIGFGQTMLSPVVEGRLLQALVPQSNERVLEIGTGSGYFTALLAQLSRHVISVELIPELSKLAQQRLTQADINNIELQIGDASSGWLLDEKFDVIIATAAFTSVPDSYKKSLNVGGRMLVVIGEGEMMSIQLIKRVTELEWLPRLIAETVIPPMVNAEPKPTFEF